MKEIELKAHVYDRLRTEAAIALFASYVGIAEKSDAYWHNPLLPTQAQTVRVRQQKNVAPDSSQTAEILVTCKRKETRFGIEVNDETEFSVSDAAAFTRLLCDQGYRVMRKKTKNARQWRFENVFIEVCAVGGLGDFIEIEILSEREDAAHIDECRKKLLQILAKSGIDEKQIESAYYSELLERVAAGRKDV